MGRYRGPAVKISRREGVNLSETPKVQRYLERRPYPPGQHGQRRRRGNRSDYGVRLREKQKLRFYYNVSEKQFSRLFSEAVAKEGASGTVFLQLLESRLDNVVYRLGIAYTRRQSRQLVVHGHIKVNGKILDIPSYRINPGDTIEVVERSKSNVIIKNNIEASRRGKVLPWLEFNSDDMKGKFMSLPATEDLNVPVNILYIIEYYSR